MMKNFCGLIECFFRKCKVNVRLRRMVPALLQSAKWRYIPLTYGQAHRL